MGLTEYTEVTTVASKNPKRKKPDMALVALFMEILFSAVLAACMRAKVVQQPSTVYVDCCDPGIDEGTKWMCDRAIKNPDHTLIGADGIRYEYVWSDCKIGEEPWRKYEDAANK